MNGPISSAEESDLLTTDSVGPYLRSRGLADSRDVEAVELEGGVSNVVLAVKTGRLNVVVKQSLQKLRVADEWLAKRERIVTEARALRLAGTIEPGSVPRVLDSDAERAVIVIERAPADWRTFKERLLSGEADSKVAARCGEILGSWHTATWADAEIESTFPDLEAFDQLRVDPYYRTAAARNPDLREAVYDYIDLMADNRMALVHGDFSPKNVMAGKSGLWVLDFEIAHFGDPVFDVAFMVNHLMLKSIHRPESSDGYRECAEAFWRAYQGRLDQQRLPEPAYVFGHVGCLMLARVDGKSPAEYLSEPARHRAREIASHILSLPPGSIDDAWRLLKT